jgi:hypothetical protein
MHYSAANYWTPGWVYPRSQMREPFPRKERARWRPAFPPPNVPEAGLPGPCFSLPPRREAFVLPQRGESFDLPPRREVYLLPGPDAG